MTFRELSTFACGVKNKSSQDGELFITLAYMSLSSGSAKSERTGEWMALSEKLSLILILFHTSSFLLGRKSESCTKTAFEEIIQLKFYRHKVYQSRDLTWATMRRRFLAVKTKSYCSPNFSLSRGMTLNSKSSRYTQIVCFGTFGFINLFIARIFETHCKFKS